MVRKKPVEVEAVLWTGHEDDIAQVFALITDKDGIVRWPEGIDSEYVGGPGLGYIPALGLLDIPTLEGTMTASPGDWIIRGVAGEIYPCKPEIFFETYERADGEAW